MRELSMRPSADLAATMGPAESSMHRAAVPWPLNSSWVRAGNSTGHVFVSARSRGQSSSRPHQPARMDQIDSFPKLATEQLLDTLHGKRVLVTGGAGFVGSRLTRALVARGASVVVLDDLSTGRRELLADGIVEGSVTDIPTVERCVEGANYVFHLAVRNIILSTRELRDDYAVNIGGTLNVLMAARGSRSLQRLVYTSSVSIYGNPRSLPISEDEG